MQGGYMHPKTSENQRDTYDVFYQGYLKAYMDALERAGRGKADPDELERYQAMRRFRDYVMDRYRIVEFFGNQVLFELNPTTLVQE